MADINRPGDWNGEDTYWREQHGRRPYAQSGRTYDYYRPAYRYGVEAASRYEGREWKDVEADLRRDWETYPHRGTEKSTWDSIKDAVRDAWDRVMGRTTVSR